MFTKVLFWVLILSLSAPRLSTMALYSTNAFPEPEYETVPGYGRVVAIGEGVINVSIESSVIRNVVVSPPLTIDMISINDTVALTTHGGVVYATNVLAHRAYRGDKGLKGTYKPPAPINVRVIASSVTFPLFKWDWGGTAEEFLQFSHYDVDAKEPGGEWGYDLYPVTETKDSHTSRLPAAKLQVRVRAVSHRGVPSAWVTCDDLLVDVLPPPVPSPFSVESAEGYVTLKWDTPTYADAADLDYFLVYVTDDPLSMIDPWTGTPDETIVVRANQYVYNNIIPGTTKYFNVVSVDIVGNISAFASTTYLDGTNIAPGGVNLLPNADFERDLDGDSVADYWYLVTLPAGPLKTYGTYGMDGTKGYLIEFDYPSEPESVSFACPIPRSEFKILNQPGHWLSLSVYIRATTLDADDFHLMQLADDTAVDGKLNVRLKPDYHDGSYTGGTYNPDRIDRAVVKALADDWYRLTYSMVAEDNSATGDIYVAYSLYIINKMTEEVDLWIDKAKMEWGRYSTAWTPGVLPSPDGLALDTAGIVSGDGTLKIGPDGKFYSSLIPNSDNAYNLGVSGSLRWKNAYFTGSISANTVATGGNVLVGGNAVPTTDDSSDLGTSAFRWKDIHISNKVKGYWQSLANTYATIVQFTLGLRGFWPMSSFARDHSGYNVPFTYVGGWWQYASGCGVPHYVSDGTSGDYLTIPNNAAHQITGTEGTIVSYNRGLTLAGWFKPGRTTAAEALFNKWGASGQYGYSLSAQGATTGDPINMTVSENGTTYTSAQSTNGFTTGWHWMAGRFDTTSGDISVMLDDTITDQATAYSSINNCTAPLNIGAGISGANPFQGASCLCFLCASSLSDDSLGELYELTKELFNM